MERQLRVGIVGTGHWATEAHIPGFQTCPGVVVAAICSRTRQRGEEAARVFGVLNVYTSPDVMIAEEDLDLVSIVTPDDCHAAAAEAAIAAGVAILCEKPLARTYPEARALADAARAAGVQTKVGFTMRYAPAMLRLQELVAGGDLGRPYLLQLFLQNGQFLDPGKPRHWKMTREQAGGGAVVEYGIHGLDLANWLLGPPVRVSAAGRTWIPERPAFVGGGPVAVDVDDSCVWLMEFAGGALGVCHAGWATVGRAPGLELRIYGSDGAAQVVLSDDLPGSEILRVATADDQRFMPTDIPARLATPLPFDAPWWRRFHHNLISHFVDEIRDQTPREPTFEAGARAQEALEGVLSSMATDQWVTIRTDGR